MITLSKDSAELLFRLFFSFIFLGLGAEHLFSDELIQQMMPSWIPLPRVVSILCGVWLLCGGGLVAIGYRVRFAASALALFLIVVTMLVHLPGVISAPPPMEAQDAWMWTVLQRSNFAKNLCLFGVCLQLMFHQLGKYSVEGWRS